jgi:hypothetical protein
MSNLSTGILDDPEPCSCDEALALRAELARVLGENGRLRLDVEWLLGLAQDLARREGQGVTQSATPSARTRNGWSSSHRGVYWHAKSARWRARVLVAGKRVSLGAYPSEDEAASAVDCALRAKGAQRG